MFCGRCFSARMFCVFRAFCGRYPCLFCWCSSCSGSRQRRAETTGFRRLRGYGILPYPPNLCASVPICGRYFSARRFCAFRGFCGNIVSHGFHRSTQMVGCVGSPTEFTEFTEVLLRWFSHGIHGIHRSFIASHSSINLESVLWEVLLCKEVLCVPWVLWEYSLPRISQINTDGWLR